MFTSLGENCSSEIYQHGMPLQWAQKVCSWFDAV